MCPLNLIECVQDFNEQSHRHSIKNTFIPSVHGDCFRVRKILYSEETQPALTILYHYFNGQQQLHVYPFRMTQYIPKQVLSRIFEGVNSDRVNVIFRECDRDRLCAYLTIRGAGIHTCVCARFLTCLWHELWCMSRWHNPR